MTVTTTTHLNFSGSARRALEFYHSVFGGALVASTYAEVGAPADSPDADKVVFGLVQADNGFRIMAYDIPGAVRDPQGGSTHREFGATITDRAFFVSLRGESLAEVEGFWSGLAEGAVVVEPLAASAWSAGFGMLTDRFGVTWAVDVQPQVTG